LRDRRIRLNVLSPGHTPILEDLRQDDALVQMKKEMQSNVPLGRLGDPDETAEAVSFLASEESSCASGAERYVDGGVAQV
jgi:NAD(P)-dependent dehydrogenase (short-subunit alcohol dehydrogenase family)